MREGWGTGRGLERDGRTEERENGGEKDARMNGETVEGDRRKNRQLEGSVKNETKRMRKGTGRGTHGG